MKIFNTGENAILVEDIFLYPGEKREVQPNVGQGLMARFPEILDTPKSGLTEITGLGKATEISLREEGVTTIEQLSDYEAEAIGELAQTLGRSVAAVAAWVGEARCFLRATE